MKNWILISGIVFALFSVIFGAFGAHALKKVLDESSLASFETGIRYQMYHALALIGLALCAYHFPHVQFKWAGICFIAGIILFSFSIYMLNLGKVFSWKVAFLGPITPIGGLLLITGWLIWLIKILKV